MKKIGFLLLPEFSHLSLASMTEPLRMANRAAGEPAFSSVLFGYGTKAVKASDGVSFHCDSELSATSDLYALIVVAGLQTSIEHLDSLCRVLRDLSRRGVVMGATSTGAHLLAEAGLLRDRKCTLHWEAQASFVDRYPMTQVTGNLYEVDSDRWTCSGGTAGIDMMIAIIQRLMGSNIAHAVAEQCIHPDVRQANTNQRISLLDRYQIRNPRLLKAIEIMQANIESPLSIDEIARFSSVSKRHLERLFEQNIRTRPAAFYNQLRLEHAQGLLRQSTLSVSEIAALSGFTTTAYFSRRYKLLFGVPPKDDRHNPFLHAVGS